MSETLQVCAVFENAQTEKREVDGLMEAFEAYSLEKGVILTLDVADNVMSN